MLELGGGVLLCCDLAEYWCFSAPWASINLQGHVQLWLGVSFLLREALAFFLWHSQMGMVFLVATGIIIIIVPCESHPLLQSWSFPIANNPSILTPPPLV